MSKRRKVKDGKPAVSQGYGKVFVYKHSRIIGSAMKESITHRCNDFFKGVRVVEIKVNEAYYSAHG
jgi:hypothetical protein